MKRLVFAIVLVSCAASVSAQSGVDPSQLSKPPTDAWPTYNGDYSGRRFSPLKEITDSNVQSLSLAWMYRLGAGGPGGSIKATPLQVDGVLYFSLPDHVWAVDARTGRERWHFAWQSKGGDHIGNRGVGISGDSLYFETPDCNLVALDIKDGTERWHKSICDLDLFYFGTSAPVVIKNHVIAGVSGDDLDIPGYIEAHDP
ncbi:MAG TPA: PQQ-binding-like beta-propeller repeat protein, partial [Vicinamibacterales bacterium]|nr:PQQ-binding-like beta-propeller repeat protein [Vicinamibacterales bacterium]